MLLVHRSGQEPLEIESILVNFEGTLATDRRVHPKAKDKLNLLSKRAHLYIFTRETREVVSEVLKRVKAEVVYLEKERASEKKLAFLRRLGETRTVAIGNGVDDVPMIEEAALGFCIVGKDGASRDALRKADVVFTNILDALDFLLKPLRHQATLSP